MEFLEIVFREEVLGNNVNRKVDSFLPIVYVI